MTPGAPGPALECPLLRAVTGGGTWFEAGAPVGGSLEVVEVRRHGDGAAAVDERRTVAALDVTGASPADAFAAWLSGGGRVAPDGGSAARLAARAVALHAAVAAVAREAAALHLELEARHRGAGDDALEAAWRAGGLAALDGALDEISLTCARAVSGAGEP